MSQLAQWSSEAGEARGRILEMAREEIIREGWAAATSGRVARRAGVSKALIHYHFQDKDSLLNAVAAQCRDNVVGRVVRQDTSSAHTNPVDGFGEWMESELAARDLCIALQLRGSGSVSVVHAAEAVLTVVRSGIEHQVDRVFGVLELAPSIPSESVVDLFMTLVEGAAVVPIEPVARLRRMVETVWLGLLSVDG